jgi:predicted phosphoadenosine phosphosulfate sulfurtransferase
VYHAGPDVWLVSKTGEYVADLVYPVEATPMYADWDWDDKKQKLVGVMGLRVSESVKRQLGLYGSGSFMTGSNYVGSFAARPIYDWTDGDVWKFIADEKCDYNRAYDVLHKMGVRKAALRIGPPTLNVASLEGLQVAARAWPRWFDRVATRLKGVRTAVQFGKRVIQPYRRYGETWEDCFKRECLSDAPEWVRERAAKVMDKVLSGHAHHSTSPFPETKLCPACGMLGSWRILASVMWGGDPICQKVAGTLQMVEPSFFRPGAMGWVGGKEFARRLREKGLKLKIPGLSDVAVPKA